jgi:putative ABC transport system permease protein
VDLSLAQGTLDHAGDEDVAISRSKADDTGWTVGRTLPIEFTDGTTEDVTIRAIYEDNELLGAIVVPSALYQAHTAQGSLRTVLVSLDPDADINEARSLIEPIARRYAGEVQDSQEFASAATQGLDMLLGIVYVLLALAIIIAALGIANTLSLAVHERRREIGLLRAVGQSRRQVRSVLRLESLIIATFGALLGLVIGGFAGTVLFAALPDTPGGPTLPAGQLVVVTALGIAAGVLAARRPAKRAARVPILDAIAAR